MDFKTVLIYGDNTGAIHLAHEHKNTAKTKHIEIEYHSTRNYIEKGYINLEYIQSSEMLADCMTKPLKIVKLEKFASAIGMGRIVKPEEEC